MKDIKKIERYAERIKSKLHSNVQTGVGIDISVYPAEEKGGVIEIKLNKNTNDTFHLEDPKRSVNDVMRAIPQRLVGGDLSGVSFDGTNISMEGNRILFVKGNDNEWDVSSADTDLSRIFNPPKKEIPNV